jgi:hypothetical protein
MNFFKTLWRKLRLALRRHRERFSIIWNFETDQFTVIAHERGNSHVLKTFDSYRSASVFVCELAANRPTFFDGDGDLLHQRYIDE